MMNLREPIVFITGNVHKVERTQRYIHVPMTHKKLDLTEIQSLDPQEVIEHKLKEAYNALKQPVLVEDTSLIFHELGKLPGPFIKWFLEELGTEKLCELIDKDRRATALVTIGVYDGEKIHFVQGIEKGTIAEAPRGKNGFGWDPIFIPEGKTKTHGEMTEEEIDAVSCRRIAVEKLKTIL